MDARVMREAASVYERTCVCGGSTLRSAWLMKQSVSANDDYLSPRHNIHSL